MARVLSPPALKKRLTIFILAGVCALLGFIRSTYFFGEPSSWLYEHGCASYSSFQYSSVATTTITDNGLQSLTTVANNILSKQCIPLSFSRMADNVSVLLRLSRTLAERSKQPHNDLELEGLHDDMTHHLFPFVSKNFPGKALLKLKSTYSHDRGIVIPVGVHGWRMAAQSIAIIQKVHNCTLPIQIVYAGNGDLPGPAQLALRRISPDIELVDILDFYDENIVGLITGGWAIKPFAVLASSFKEVLLADADTVFLQSPDVFFEDTGYQHTGTWFFHDEDWKPQPITRHWARGQAWLQQVLKNRQEPELSDQMQQSRWLSGESENEAESGVVVLDKKRSDVLITLLFICWMNTKQVRKVTYHYTWGDKESFWLPFELVHIPYHFEQSYAAGIGDIVDGKLCGHPLHVDESGAPLWHNGGTWRKKEDHGLGSLRPQVWIENESGWEQDLCMHRFAARHVHRIEGSPLHPVVQRLTEVAEATEEDWSFVQT